MANVISQLERELGAIFGAGPRRRVKAAPPAPQPDRFVVQLGASDTPTNQTTELGRYPTWQKARDAQLAYNEAHPDDDIYAYAPVAL